MAHFAELPADQQAVLQLILRQDKSYAEIAELLRTTPEAIRERALVALDALGPGGPDELGDDEQDDLGDYLLGQQAASRRLETREALEGSAPARAWARGVAAELRAGSPDADLPDIPSEPAEIDEAFGALEARQRAAAERESAFRTGTVLLGIGALLAIAVLVLVLAGVFGDDDEDVAPVTTAAATATAPATTTAATPTTGTTQTTPPQVERRVTLVPPSGPARGTGDLVRRGSGRAIVVLATRVPAGTRYALWLSSSASGEARRLGFFNAVTGSGDRAGRLEGLATAPADLADYDTLLVTRETSNVPVRPGTVVLRGDLG